MNRILTVAVAIIGIVVIAAGVWFVFIRQKAQAPTPPAETVSTTQAYASTTLGVSLQYPSGYIINELYVYDQFGPKKLIHGVSFSIPAAMATGTNLSTDTHLSVEQLPNAKNCTGDIYLPANVKAHKVTEGGVDYSLATSSGAAAGNLYEEQVYALVGTHPCTAVRYTIHSMNIGNYPSGAVTEFDHAKIIGDFDGVRRSLTLSSVTP
jgi:hypothetical protein